MRIPSIFEHIQRSEIIDTVQAEVTFSYQYFSFIILSAIIATFGLLLGNTAIIIGAMIIAPLIWPIIGTSVGTVTSRTNLAVSSVLLLIISTILTVLTAYLITVISPISEINNEILIRTNPTFFDLIIALAAGTAAILIIAWPKYSNSLAGVAVAASVLPPICVTGIGLAVGSLQLAYGSFVLFLTNTASIIFVGFVIFAILGFFKKNSEEEVRKVEFGLGLSFIVILLLSFQLIFSLSQIIYSENAEVIIEETLTRELHEISSDITVDSVSVDSLSQRDKTANISSVVRVPSDIAITVTQKNRIVRALSGELAKEINLELKIVPVLRVVSEGNDNKTKQEETKAGKIAQEVIAEKIVAISSRIVIDSVAVTIRQDQKVKNYQIEVHIKLPHDVVISYSDKQDISFELSQRLQRPVTLNIKAIRIEEI